MEEVVDEFRALVGDEGCMIDAGNIISWTNRALGKLWRARGIEKLFRYQDTFELAHMNADGSASASWLLKSGESLGTINNIESLLFFSTDDCHPCSLDLCYMPYDWFRKEHPFPEKCEKGMPSDFTINQFGGDLKIIFDRPVDGHYSVDMVYTASHPVIKKLNDVVKIPIPFIDLLLEMIRILYHKESADYALARADYEDWDYFIDEAREMLARQSDGLPLRKIRGSF